MRVRLLIVAVLVAALVVPAAQATPSRATPREGVWLLKLSPVLGAMSKYTGRVARLTHNPEILVRGSNAQLQMAINLAGMRSCMSMLNRRGPAPTARTAAIRAAVASACGHFGRFAILFARGIDAYSASLIDRAGAQMSLGNKAIGLAQRRVNNL